MCQALLFLGCEGYNSQSKTRKKKNNPNSKLNKDSILIYYREKLSRKVK